MNLKRTRLTNYSIHLSLTPCRFKYPIEVILSFKNTVGICMQVTILILVKAYNLKC